MPLRCAILDDYQNVALSMADWSKVDGDIDIKVFNEHLGSTDKVVTALQGFAIICAMRERTPFPRAVIDALPDLKLLITTGMRNASIDLEAATARGVVVCGTPAFGNATAGVATGLMLELARHIGFENAQLKAGAAVANDNGIGSRRLDACAARPGQARHAHGRDRPRVQNECHRLEPEISRRKRARPPAWSMSAATNCSAVPIFCRFMCNCRSARAA